MDWASIPGKSRADLPTSVLFSGREVAIYTFAQVDRLGKKALKERAMNLRDLVGAQRLPRFSPGFPEEQIVAWILEAQIIVAAASGVCITVADLGAPKGGDGVGAFLAHLNTAPQQQRSPGPPPSQQTQQEQFFQQQQQPQQPQRQPQQAPRQLIQQQPEAEPTYVLDAILDVRTDERGLASHFLCKFEGHPIEEASWEPADQIQDVAPRQVAEFKMLLQRQQRQQPTPTQQYQPPPSQASQGPPHTHAYRADPSMASQSRASPATGSSPLRPDQESDAIRDAARKRNQGSFAFG